MAAPAVNLVNAEMNPHVKFATLTMGESLSPATTTYLTTKYTRFQEESNNMDPTLWVPHVLQLPYKVAALAIQTVADAILAVAFIIATAFTLNMHAGCRQEMKGRIHNLLVADVLSWLAMPASLFHPSALSGANSLHLGTMRMITP